MLVIVHAVFSGVWCLTVGGLHSGTLIALSSVVWIIVRVCRRSNWRWIYPLVTVSLLGLLLWTAAVWQSTSLNSVWYGFLAVEAILLASLLVLFVDFFEALTRLYCHFQSPETCERLQNFLFRHGLRILLWGTAGCILLYSTIVPVIQELDSPPPETIGDATIEMDRLTLPQNALFRFCESTTGAWFFVIGCCVGSFLNVVIFRVPAGISVLAKASHCPKCQTKISGRDNLPLIGWLKLQGRCRNCETSISSRYPSVELTIGLLFLLLYFVELISGGTNLPVRLPNMYAGVLWILFYTKWDLVGLYVFHISIFCALFCWTMIQRDGHRVPAKASAITILLSATAILVWPHLLPFASETDGIRGDGSLWQRISSTSIVLLTGAATGLFVGGILRRLSGLPQQLVSWLLIGMVFGWQSVIVIAVLTVAAKFLITLAELLTEESRPTLLRTTSGSSEEDTLAQANISAAQIQNADLAPVLAPAELPLEVHRTIMPAMQWWLLPAVLLLHHCFWRHLFILVEQPL